MSQAVHAGETGPWCRSLLHMMCGVHRAACLHMLPMHPASSAGRALGAVAHSRTQLSAHSRPACSSHSCWSVMRATLQQIRGGCAARCAACAMRSSSARRRSWPAARSRRTTCSAARCGCWARWPRCAWRACATAACSAGRSPVPPLLMARSPQKQAQGLSQRGAEQRVALCGCRACGCPSAPSMHA